MTQTEQSQLPLWRAPSQAAMILDYLRAGNRLTPLTALSLFGCLRLGARIHELKTDPRYGFPDIRTDIRTIPDTGKRVAVYTLQSTGGGSISASDSG